MSGFVGALSAQQLGTLSQMKEKLDKTLEGEMQECCRKMLSDDAMILRFLRARKFDLEKSYEMINNMLKFRLEFQKIGVDALTSSSCENELKTGKSIFYKYDKSDRPVCYIRARLHDSGTSEPLENQRYCVLMMEYGRHLLRAPGETVTIVFDMTNTTVKNLDLKSVQFMVQTLQNFYPESLGKVLVYNATWIVNGAWRIVRPWLDPVTAAKVVFVKKAELLQDIPAENLPVEYAGQDPFVYDYTAYKDNFEKIMSPQQ